MVGTQFATGNAMPPGVDLSRMRCAGLGKSRVLPRPAKYGQREFHECFMPIAGEDGSAALDRFGPVASRALV